MLANEFDHAFQIVAGSRQRIEQWFAPTLAAIEGFEGHLVVFDIGIVKTEGDVGGLLDGGNDDGQKLEHFFHAHGYLLGAVHVEIDELSTGIGLEFGKVLIARNVTRFPSAAGAAVGVVDQLANDLGIGGGGCGRGG